MLSTERFYRLTGGVRHYAWGESIVSTGGRCPYIPQLLSLEPGDDPWAELWLGAHPSLPSVLSDGTPLADAIAQAPEQWLGNNGGTQLAYLFKVLSCSHALSIQSHPDEKSAIALHAAHPELYPDPHDKTEIIIAITPFEAMAGLREPAMIEAALTALPALKRALYEPWKQSAHAQSLRGLCEVLFALPQSAIEELYVQLHEALDSSKTRTDAEELFLYLEHEYPNDRGALFAFLLNHKRLSPGEALFLAPNSPHAYIHGTGVECMTNSDNVIRAGLTGKAIDVPTLLDTVDFERFGAQPVEPVVTKSGDGNLFSYNPPTPKFKLQLLKDVSIDFAQCTDGLGMLLILNGEMTLTAGGCSVKAQKGTCWVRPSALKNGTAVPASLDTRAVWVQTAFNK